MSRRAPRRRWHPALLARRAWPAAPPRRHTLTGTFRHHLGFVSAHLGYARDVIVYLPPGYEGEPGRRYPVLYLQDGQNVFDAATAFDGTEWEADETAERLIGAGRIEPLIMAAVYNSPDRAEEYTQAVDPEQGGGRADAYGRFLAEELKPFVDAAYRTRPDPEATAIGGSSLGGLVSLYLGMTRPDVFRRIAAISPAVWWADGEIESHLAGPAPGARLWLDVGTDEGGAATTAKRLVRRLRAVRDRLVEKGWRLGREMIYLEERGGRHHESDWGRRMERMLPHLFPAPKRSVRKRPAPTTGPGPAKQAAGAVRVPIDGILDLHTYRPDEVKDLVAEYLDACRTRGILRVRIIHGKGTGSLRRTVHSVLAKTAGVESFRLAGEDRSGWGATIVTLAKSG